MSQSVNHEPCADLCPFFTPQSVVIVGARRKAGFGFILPIAMRRQGWGDRLFLVNPAGGDYHIGPGSAAYNRGTDAGVATDMDGDPRPDSCFPDLGADELITGLVCRRVYLPVVLRN